MKVQIACMSFGLTFGLALATATSANAADWAVGNGSIRDMGGIKDMGGAGGVPVPAPVPIPEYKPNWYFRLDAGIGMISEPDFSESGFVYGVTDGPGPAAGPGDARTLPTSLFGTDFNSLFTAGGGVGYYLGNGWRIDGTIEKRSKDDAVIDGTDQWDTYGYFDFDTNPLTPVTWGALDTNTNGIVDRQSRLTINDTSSLKGTVWMANAYYDLANMRGFTPYVGAGVGFVWNQISRTHTSTLDSCDNEAGPGAGCAGGIYTGAVTTTATNKGDTVSLAAAAMAGFSYDLSDITSIDVGYRFLYLAGTSNDMTVCCNESRVTIGDQSVHQLRAGLRFNVN